MPSLIVLAGIALATVLIEADSAGSDRWLAQWPRLFGAGPEGARVMMSTIAGSMMSVVGVTFSMMTPITTALVVEADKLAVQQQALLDEAEKRAADALDGIAKEKK